MIRAPTILSLGYLGRHGDGELIAGAAARKEAASPRTPIDNVGIFAQEDETVCERDTDKGRENKDREIGIKGWRMRIH